MTARFDPFESSASRASGTPQRSGQRTLDPYVAARAIPLPRRDELPCEFADRLGVWQRERTTGSARKRRGQYFTPVPIARFMASLVSRAPKLTRVLDPGAGTAVLTCALCERLAALPSPPRTIRVELYESDPSLAPPTKRVLYHLSRWLEARGIRLETRLEDHDFILQASRLLDEATASEASGGATGPREFDLVISNPPYFKLSRSDPRVAATRALVSGQTNIYSLFMGLSARLLAPAGELVVITPRSFASGAYFRRFRREFFARMRPERIHSFESRAAAFKRDAILQENLILHARRMDGWQDRARHGKLTLSTSDGSSAFERVDERKLERALILAPESRQQFLYVPSSRADDDVMRRVHGWTGSLRDHGLEISTGRVVAFRARALLHAGPECEATLAPLLWMQHVRPMRIEWPIASLSKPQQMHATSHEAHALLLDDRHRVVLRRFSGKEEARRLVAAPLERGQLASSRVGLENHLNTIHRPGGEMDLDEVWGLAALLSSRLFDRYFRTLSGSTQVNAAELRAMRLPGLPILRAIGERVRFAEEPASEADRAVGESLR